MLGFLHLFYFYGVIACAVTLAVDHIFDRTMPNRDDLIIVLFWPYFAVVAFWMTIKGLFNLIKFLIKTSKK